MLSTLVTNLLNQIDKPLDGQSNDNSGGYLFLNLRENKYFSFQVKKVCAYVPDRLGFLFPWYIRTYLFEFR